MRISDWSSDVCSSDLQHALERIERGSALDRAVHQLDGKPDKSKKRGCDKGGGDYVERRDTVPPDGEACLIERSGQWRQAAEEARHGGDKGSGSEDDRHRPCDVEHAL